jgi:hypothetical protein
MTGAAPPSANAWARGGLLGLILHESVSFFSIYISIRQF